ncbi:MAG: flagellar biosynthesis protein FlgD [Clostridiaceae bacterium]|nr:flagellar biosynthesis protein FlgD [Clostridiaceae bacterium]
MPEVSPVKQMTIEEIINSKDTGRNVSNELGKDEFFKLLITQLRYQNPLEPMDDRDFIAQIAQFSALEQMQNLNHSFSYSMGFSLLGKYITAAITDDKTGETRYISGEVSSVHSQSGKVYLVVNDFDVPLDNIAYVSEKSADYKSADLEKYNSLIGLLSTVETTLAEDESLYKIEGIVARIEKRQDGIYATLDEVILSVNDIDRGAFESVEAFIEGMRGMQITFTAKDAFTGQKIRLEGVLRDGVKDEERDCYHVILDNVQVPVGDIVSTQKVDLVSTEQQLLRQILETLKSLETKLPGETAGIGENTETPETEEPETPDSEATDIEAGAEEPDGTDTETGDGEPGEAAETGGTGS